MSKYVDPQTLTPERPVYDKAGMHQINVNSGLKAFDNQVVSLAVGNVWDNAYLGNYIRPTSELECNGFTNSPGHLLAFDLQGFKFPHNTREKFVKEIDAHNGGILYMFWHTYRPREYYPYSRGRKVARVYGPTQMYHGLLLTDREFNYVTHVTFGNPRDWDVIWACMQFLCTETSLRKQFKTVRKDG